MIYVLVSGSTRQFHDRKPKIFNGLDDTMEFLKAHRLRDIAITSHVIGTLNVWILIGCREDRDRECPELGVCLDLFEDFPTIFFGNIQIKENQVW